MNRVSLFVRLLAVLLAALLLVWCGSCGKGKGAFAPATPQVLSTS